MQDPKYLDEPCNRTETAPKIDSTHSQYLSQHPKNGVGEPDLDIALVLDSTVDFPKAANEVVAISYSAIYQLQPLTDSRDSCPLTP